MFYSHWGGGGGVRLHKNVSHTLATIDFLRREIATKTLSVRKNVIGNINLGQTSLSLLNSEKFGISNLYIPDCLSEPFA